MKLHAEHIDKEILSEKRPAMVISLATVAVLLFSMNFIWTLFDLLNESDVEMSFVGFVVQALLFLIIFYSLPGLLIYLFYYGSTTVWHLLRVGFWFGFYFAFVAIFAEVDEGLVTGSYDQNVITFKGIWFLFILTTYLWLGTEQARVFFKTICPACRSKKLSHFIIRGPRPKGCRCGYETV